MMPSYRTAVRVINSHRYSPNVTFNLWTPYAKPRFAVAVIYPVVTVLFCQWTVFLNLIQPNKAYIPCLTSAPHGVNKAWRPHKDSQVHCSTNRKLKKETNYELSQSEAMEALKGKKQQLFCPTLGTKQNKKHLSSNNH